MDPQNSTNTAVIAAVAAVSAAAIAFIANIVTTIMTFYVAKLNSNKDITLQSDRLRDDRIKTEVAFLRTKLEEVHVILSKIELENSRTISFFHSTSGITIVEFRLRYQENCERIHKAVCVTDLYFDEMSPAIRKIYHDMHLFWGNQETLIGITAASNQQAWDKAFIQLQTASNEISAKAQEVQRSIVTASKALSSMLKE